MTKYQDITVSDIFVQPSSSNHAELPIWDVDDQLMAWVDMEPEPTIHALKHLEASANKRIRIPDREFCTGIFWQRGKDKHFPLIGTKFGFEATTLSCQDGRVKSMRMVADIRDLDPNYPNAADWKTIRLNEATTDPKGRIWFASCKEGDSPIQPALYLFDPATRDFHKILLGIDQALTMPNAMVFGPDAKHFYLGCSIAGKVWRWDVSLDEENPQKILSNPRTVITIDKPAVPDGMTCDTEGRLYLAVFNQGRINVYGPEGGEPLYAIYLPAQCPTSTVFAGKNLDQLVITTHNVPFDLRKQVIEGGLGTAEELDERWPHRKGSIYTVQLKGVKGVPKHRVNPLVEQ